MIATKVPVAILMLLTLHCWATRMNDASIAA